MSVWKMATAVAAGVVLAAGAADAAILTVNFSGVVTTPGPGASLGSAFTGSFSYDDATALSDVTFGPGGALALYNAATDFTFGFEGISGSAELNHPLAVQDYLPGYDTADALVFFSYFGPNSTVVRLRLIDTSATAFSSYDLPGSINLSAFDIGTVQVGSPDNDIFGTIDGLRVTVVPEPATWAMMIAGFGLAGAAMRRRRRLVGQG